MYNETVIFYSKNPPNRGALKKFDISYWEENRICGDDLKVYMKIDEGCMTDWSFEGDTAIITTACASIFGESILGMKLDDILSLDSKYIEELIEMSVSPRRKQASVLGLLSTRNAIHSFLKDGKKDTFDSVIV